MMQLIDSYHDVAADDGDDPQDEGLGDDDRLTPVAEEEDDEEMIGGGGGRRERGGGGRKQVRFSSGLPPTRQSRFGRQDEDDIPRSVSPDQQVYLVCIFQPKIRFLGRGSLQYYYSIVAVELGILIEFCPLSLASYSSRVLPPVVTCVDVR